MAEPVLVTDLGRYSTKAALLAGGPATMLRDPRTGADWPGIMSMKMSCASPSVRFMSAPFGSVFFDDSILPHIMSSRNPLMRDACHLSILSLDPTWALCRHTPKT